MADTLRVVLEVGPKGKKVVAVAPDWPGLERAAATEEEATARLLSYVPRYAAVATVAGVGDAFVGAAADVVERFPGNGSTDFWGVSFAFSCFDRQETSRGELDRELVLLRGCWAFFDGVRSRVSAEMRRGPRGGGRDRAQIVGHTVGTELDWSKKLGLPGRPGSMPTDAELAAHRDAYCGAIRAFHAEAKKARSWPLRYLIRRTAHHTMDHAWEMEDKDLTAT